MRKILLLIVLLFFAFGAYRLVTRGAVPPDSEVVEALFVPQKKEGARSLDLSVRAAGLYYLDERNELTELYAKNADVSTPIASVTKLMLALVSAETYAEIDTFTMTKEVLSGKGPSGFFKEGDTFLFPDLLKAVLIESNNDGARALALKNGEEGMVDRMNEKASELELFKTHFRTPTGLDLDAPHEASNVSSPYDLARLLSYLKTKHAEILDITKEREFELKNVSGEVNHVAKTTNRLLDDSEFRVVGGKTGDTPLSKKNLAVIVESPRKDGYFVSVVLGSDDHFSDTKKLIQWGRESFGWE